MRVTLYPREELGKELLASYVDQHRFPMVQSKLAPAGWTLEPPGVQALMEKLRANGVPLANYTDVKPYYGVKTGCNEAFIVDQATKERLCREDPRSAELLRKYLRGQDIARWAPEWAGLWMIFSRRGINIEQYPASLAHLTSFRSSLEPKPHDFVGETWPGRKPGTYKWFEIQDAVAYHELFDRPKLVYQVIQFHPAFAVETDGLLLNDKGFLLPTTDQWLIAALNSPAMWWHNWRYLVHMKDEALNPAGDKLVHVPIPRPSGRQAEVASSNVHEIVALTRQVAEATAGVVDVLRVEFGVETPGQALSDFAGLDSEAFVQNVRKRRPKKGSPLTPAGLKALRGLYEAEVPSILEKRARILQLERALASAVHEAYGLTAEDLALMRETQPPRVPPGW